MDLVDRQVETDGEGDARRSEELPPSLQAQRWAALVPNERHTTTRLRAETTSHVAVDPELDDCGAPCRQVLVSDVHPDALLMLLKEKGGHACIKHYAGVGSLREDLTQRALQEVDAQTKVGLPAHAHAGMEASGTGVRPRLPLDALLRPVGPVQMPPLVEHRALEVHGRVGQDMFGQLLRGHDHLGEANDGARQRGAIPKRDEVGRKEKRIAKLGEL